MTIIPVVVGYCDGVAISHVMEISKLNSVENNLWLISNAMGVSVYLLSLFTFWSSLLWDRQLFSSVFYQFHYAHLFFPLYLFFVFVFVFIRLRFIVVVVIVHRSWCILRRVGMYFSSCELLEALLEPPAG